MKPLARLLAIFAFIWPGAAVAQVGLETQVLDEGGATVRSGSAELGISAGQSLIGAAQAGPETLGVGYLYTLPLDIQPPRTDLVIGPPRFDGAGAYISSYTLLGFTAVDDLLTPGDNLGSGVAETRFAVDSASFGVFASSFALTAEGVHMLFWFSKDLAGNAETLRGKALLVDATPPVTSVAIGTPTLTAPDGTIFVTPATAIALSANDPALPTGQPGSGVKRIEISTDGSAASSYAAALTFAEGRHTISFRAVDNLGNAEAARTLNVQSDATPPISALLIGQPQSQLSGILLVSTRTPFSIVAVDPVVNNVASGVKDSWFNVADLTQSTGAFQTFTAVFTMSGLDAEKVIGFYSRDNVLNTEVTKSSTVLLDATPPEVALLSPASCDSGICRVLKGKLSVLGTARDAHLASYVLDFAPGKDAAAGFTFISSGTVSVSSGALGTWDATALSGWQTLRLTAADLVQNVSALALNVFIGDPSELMTLGNHDVLNMPEDVAVGPGGTIYVADRNNDRVAVFSSTGALLASFGVGRDLHEDDRVSTGTLRLNKPAAVAVDAAGNVYVADTNDDRVLKLSPLGQILLNLGRREHSREGEHDGQFEHHAEGRLPGRFNKPSGIAVDAAQNIYVADTQNRRVQVFGSTGAFAFQFSLPPLPQKFDDNQDVDQKSDKDDDAEIAKLGKPFGIALDAFGGIYVADPNGRRALKFDPTGQLLLTIPIAGEQPGSFGLPFGVAVSSSGKCLLVSDRKTSRILKFDFQGAQNLVFGSKGRFKDDAQPQPSSTILFKKPMGLALDDAGSLYVADRNNDRIRKFSLPTGQPTLVAPPAKPDDDFVARDIVDKDDGGKVARKDKAAVDIPAKALSDDLKITVSTPTLVSGIDEGNKQRALKDKDLKPASPPVEFHPEGTQFQTPVTLTLPYNPELIALEGVSEDDLKVHYWNRDKAQWENLESTVDKKARTISAKTSHFSLYQVLSGTASAPTVAAAPPTADASFALRDVYAFPNPSRGGQVVMLRVQVGVADEVGVNIYDISGQLVHRGSFGPPQIFDDGNGKGPQYTYDYRWDVSGVGSGVYLYAITAKKAGASAIRKIGRVGVIK